jgi:hypothetical protein
MVSRKCTFQLSLGLTFPSAAAEQALGQNSRAQPERAALDRRSEAGAASADDEHLMFDGLNLRDVHAIPFPIVRCSRDRPGAARADTSATIL